MENEIEKKPNSWKPTKIELVKAYISFSGKERYVFWAFIAIAVFSAIYLVQSANRLLMSEVPTYGGTFTEGIVGTPRFVNPILAISDADRDVTMLVYSGLLRKSPDGGYIPDLAEKYEISQDGLTYTFILRDKLYFHDGTPITSDDVEFTVLKAKDPNLKSPRRPSWEGVAVQKTDRRTISFILKQPYAQFLENATMGIVPKNTWRDVPVEQWGFSDLNLKGIGSGPYRIDSITKNKAGIPVSYELSSFKKFALGRPYIDEIKLKFYGNEEELISAFRSGEIDGINAIMPEEAKMLRENGAIIKQYPLPRVYGIFFNQSHAPVLTEIDVRRALSEAAPRGKIVDTVLYGYATPIYGPTPRSKEESLSKIPGGSEGEDLPARARKELETKGWKFDEKEGAMVKKTKKENLVLSFSISTGDKPELKAAAAILKEEWEKMGAKIEVKIFEPGDLNQNVIRPRKYDALLFGEIVSEDSDPYAFWHSSQKNDPGLNVAMYTNAKVDKILEEARGTLDEAERMKKYKQFEEELGKDVPAVFLYSPDFIYLTSKEMGGMKVGYLTVSAERFVNIYKWYEETDWVWKIFTRDSNKQNI